MECNKIVVKESCVYCPYLRTAEPCLADDGEGRWKTAISDVPTDCPLIK